MSSEPSNKPANVWPFFAIGIVLLALFFIGTKALLSLPEPPPAEDAARSAERTKAYQDLQAENQQKLTTFAWADAQKGTVQIPIELAMQLTAERLASQTPTPAGPVNPPPADAAPAAPAAPEAAPSPSAQPAPSENSPATP
jgi:hypothetical protein